MTTQNSEDVAQILLVDDNPGDVELTQRTIEKSEYKCNVTVAEDGEVAMAYLKGEGEHAGAPRPDLILLDLKMPKKDGQQVMTELKADENLSKIPVVILTTTQAERTLMYEVGIHPSRYCTKPMEAIRLNIIMRGVMGSRAKV